jgi:hypothetical protein
MAEMFATYNTQCDAKAAIYIKFINIRTLLMQLSLSHYKEEHNLITSFSPCRHTEKQMKEALSVDHGIRISK